MRSITEFQEASDPLDAKFTAFLSLILSNRDNQSIIFHLRDFSEVMSLDAEESIELHVFNENTFPSDRHVNTYAKTAHVMRGPF